MALTDANAFPTKGEALRLPVEFRDTSGNLIMGWTGAASLISYDLATTVAGNAPIEIGATGMGYVDLTGVQMNSPLVMVRLTVTNANATATSYGVYTVDLSDTAGRVATRLDRMIAGFWRRWFNKRQMNGSTLTVFRDTPNEDEVLVSGTVETEGVVTTGGELG